MQTFKDQHGFTHNVYYDGAQWVAANKHFTRFMQQQCPGMWTKTTLDADQNVITVRVDDTALIEQLEQAVRDEQSQRTRIPPRRFAPLSGAIRHSNPNTGRPRFSKPREPRTRGGVE